MHRTAGLPEPQLRAATAQISQQAVPCPALPCSSCALCVASCQHATHLSSNGAGTFSPSLDCADDGCFKSLNSCSEGGRKQLQANTESK